MKRNYADRQQRRIVFGLFIIVIGVVTLLDNLHLFDTRSIRPFWPMVLVALGSLKILQARHLGSYLVGGTLIFVGATLILQNLGMLHVNWHDWWPAFMILGGVYLIGRGIARRGDDAVGCTPGSAALLHEASVNTTAFMSGAVIKNDSADFKGGDLTAIMGGIELDLRQADIQNEAVIQVFAIWGGIALKVPADWSVTCKGMPLLGGIDDKTVPPAAPSKRLIIDGTVIMGGIEIKN